MPSSKAVNYLTKAIIIILIIASFLKRFRNNVYVDSAFKGLRPASMAMITAAGLNVAKIALFDFEVIKTAGAGGIDFSLLQENFGGFFLWKAWILAALLLVGINKFKKIHPIFFIFISAAVGILFEF